MGSKELGKDFFLSLLFSDNCAWLVNSFRVVHQLRGTSRHRTCHDDQFQIVEQWRVIFSEERDSNSSFSSTSSTTNTMGVICNIKFLQKKLKNRESVIPSIDFAMS
jgi:hypothetical protein